MTTQRIDNPHIQTLLRVADGAGVCGRDREALIRVASSYDDMLAALKEFRDDVEAAAGEKDPESWLDVEWPDLAVTYQHVCAAIAKATKND